MAEWEIVESQFEFQWSYYVHFWTNNLIIKNKADYPYSYGLNNNTVL